MYTFETSDNGSHNCDLKILFTETKNCSQFLGFPLHTDVPYTNLFAGSQKKYPEHILSATLKYSRDKKKDRWIHNCKSINKLSKNI